MRRIQAVIGANYGDEGKGKTVDFLSWESADPLVIRHNSGAQAGHTVQDKDKRHVFQHFGSGTLAGAPTLLCHKFVANPTLFNSEWDSLVKLTGKEPEVYLDLNCRMSTIHDMVLNQATEMLRSARHGSVGVGFGETIQRHDVAKVELTVRGRRPDLVSLSVDEYFREETIRRGILGHLDRVPYESGEILGPSRTKIINAIASKDFNWDVYWAEHSKMMLRCKPVPNLGEFLRSQKRDLIFEGAQGLMLHQDHEYFPHVTRCRTGAEDILELLGICQIEDPIDIFYLTRSYLTRHGEGPFPEQCEHIPGVVDETNQPNDWQGSLRHGVLDVKKLLHRIARDVTMAGFIAPNEIRWSTVVNCLDQVNSLGTWTVDSVKPSLLGYGPDSSETLINRPEFF